MSDDQIHSSAQRDRRSLALVFGIGVVVLLVELVGGLAADSLALLADAGHVFTDVAGIALALGAIWLAGRPASHARTFGWYRAEILAAAINAVILLAIAAFILWQAWQRWNEPPEVAGGLMLAVAVVGGVANLIAMLLLRGPQGRSLNMRGAYLEVLGDLLGSVAVVVAAIVITLTGFTQADAIASAVIGLIDPAAHLGAPARRGRCPAGSHPQGRGCRRGASPHPRGTWRGGRS